MIAAFLGPSVWSHITKAVRANADRCDVAVAYFGKGASRLLPLTSGSRLIVDASEPAVASGQTCPADLLKLVKRGVHVYSVANLHAKVFVLGRSAYIGSNNVSQRSSSQLVEATVRVTDALTVRAARSFVRGYCLEELGPKWLAHLATLYRPPRMGCSERKAAVRSRRSGDSAVVLAQLVDTGWSTEEQAVHDAALPVARKRREHRHGFQLDRFLWDGTKPVCQRGDVVMQVTADRNGRRLVSAPGKVLLVRTGKVGRRRVSFVFLERRARRRWRIESMANAVGCRKDILLRSGQVRGAQLRNALLSVWDAKQ